jgi:hypothetical protein
MIITIISTLSKEELELIRNYYNRNKTITLFTKNFKVAEFIPMEDLEGKYSVELTLTEITNE